MNMMQKAVIFVAAASPLYLVRFKIFGIPTNVFEILIWLLVLGVALRTIFFTEVRDEYCARVVMIPKSLIAATTVFFIAGIISVYVAPMRLSALGIWRAYIVDALLFGTIAWLHIKSYAEFRLMAWMFSVSAFIVSVYAIFQKVTGFGIPNPFWQAAETRRVTSFFGYPNAVGLYLELLIPFFVVQIFIVKKFWQRAWFSIVILMSIASIIFAESSGTVAALFGTVGILFLVWKKTRWWIVGVGIVCAITLFFSPMRKPFADEFLLQGVSGKLRTAMWSETVEMLRPRWFVGAGLAGYQERVAPYHTLKWAEIYLYPHNLVLTLWSELGALGVLSFAGIFGLMFYSVYRGATRLRGEGRVWALACMSVLVIIGIHGLVDIPYFKNDFSVLFWLLVALTMQIRYNSISTQ